MCRGSKIREMLVLCHKEMNGFVLDKTVQCGKL